MRNTTRGRSSPRAFAAALAVSLASVIPGARAQPPNYGHDFVTVDAPHNRRPNRQEARNFFPPAVGPKIVPPGRVDHRYRITRTEVTVRQWFEFVVAYAPYVEGSRTHPAFTSDWIWYRNDRYVIQPGAEDYSANMSWRNAARYCNWLHNGKVNERWAFEDGAYDTSTFVTGPNGFPLDQEAHHPGARYWVPTWDEYVKAAFYDPDRYGPGQEGYWPYPNSSETAPRPGHPWEGGETNAGIPGLYPGEYAVGSYPTVLSPWGLLDVSGGVREKTESLRNSLARTRITFGSYAGMAAPQGTDRIDSLDFYGGPPTSSSGGLRVASVVPGPSGLSVVVGCWILACRRRRISCRSAASP